MPERTYDVIVIGGGSTGENVAQRAARRVPRGGRRGGTGGRRVLVLGLHAEQIAAAAAQALAEARAVAGAADAVTGSLTSARCWRGATASSTTGTTPPSSPGSTTTGSTSCGGTGASSAIARWEDKRNGASLELRATAAVAVCTGSGAAVPPVPGWPTPGRGPAATPPVRRAFRPPRHRRGWRGGVRDGHRLPSPRVTGDGLPTRLPVARRSPGVRGRGSDRLAVRHGGRDRAGHGGSSGSSGDPTAPSSLFSVARPACATRSWWPQAGNPAPTTSAWRLSDWSQVPGSTSTTTSKSRVPPAAGCTPPAT